MRGRIEQLARGVYNYDALKLKLPGDLITCKVKKGESGKGSFHLEEENGLIVRGEVHSSTPRIQVLTPDFRGSEVDVEYLFDSAGISEGETYSGSFCIISSAGEYHLPFQATVDDSLGRKEAAPIRDLEGFVKLAVIDYDEAYKLFIKKEFAELLKKGTPRYLDIYRACARKAWQKEALEDFLGACGLKGRPAISIDSHTARFFDIDQKEEMVLPVHMTVSGYMIIHVEADVPWIHLPEETIRNEQFVGGLYDLKYELLPEKMHGGYNFGRITLKTKSQTLKYEITVTRTLPDDVREEKKKRLEIQKKQVRLQRLYMDFKHHKITLQTWTKESMAELEWVAKRDPDNHFYPLIRAQLLLAERKNDEAKWLLDRFEKATTAEESPEEWGYYLYLRSLYSRDKDYVYRMSSQIKILCGEKPGSWKLLWVLLYMDENLERNPGRKYDLIERRFHQGCHNPMIYLEAYALLVKDPSLMTKLRQFELQLLNYGMRRDLITEEIAERFSLLAMKYKQYEDLVYRLLDGCYQKYPTQNLAAAICSLLIKGNRTDEAAFLWYARGVEEGLKITRLYEFYMYSLPESYDRELPQAVLLYFLYNSSLDYRKKAMLYAGVIRHREENPAAFRNYKKHMEDFMMEQLLARHINEHLAYLYENLLEREMLTEELANALADVMFTYRLTVNAERMKYATVVHPQLEGERTVPFSGDAAYVRLYTKDAVVLLEDEEGNLYDAQGISESRRLLNFGAYLARCNELLTNHAGLILHICEDRLGSRVFTEHNIGFYQKLLGMQGLRENYKQTIKGGLLDYYYENSEVETLERFLETLDENSICEEDGYKLAEIYIERGKYREAYEAVRQFGYEQIAVRKLVKLCARLIMMADYEREDYLLSLSSYVFDKGKYDAVVLKYLLDYYWGPLENMVELWNCARKFEMDTYDFEERLLMQELFTDCRPEESDEIFLSYYRKGPKNRLKMAFLSHEAYRYVMVNRPAGEELLEILVKEMHNNERVTDMCRLAVLKYMASQKSLKESEEKLVQELVDDFAERNMYFGVYHDLAQKVKFPPGIGHKTYVEYRTSPRNQVVIFYRICALQMDKAEYSAETMRHMCEGIFVKDFTLFYGESLQYYFLVEKPDGTREKTEQKMIYQNEIPPRETGTKFDLLNDILINRNARDDSGAAGMMKRYLKQCFLTDELFGLKE